MNKDSFCFKKFSVHQERCAMKVGTDGCLLGAWAPLDGGRRVLDIGTGTGLIAMMCAQRLEGRDFHIDALDIEEGAVEQARENVEACPWNGRISVTCADVLEFEAELPYDLVVCNPPFFVDSLKCPDGKRSVARHADSLPFPLLLNKVYGLLADQGRFCVVLPWDRTLDFIQTAIENRLYLQQRVNIKTVERKDPKRVLLSFGKQIAPVEEKVLVLQSGGAYTQEAKILLRDFYLYL